MRRHEKGIRLTVLASTIAMLWFAIAIGAVAEDWPRWRGPRGDGTWNAPPLPEEWPAAGLPVVWRQPIGGGYAGVTVADGLVYTMDRLTEPREVERILCFAADTGRLVWSREYEVRYGDMGYGNGPRAAPTVDRGRVYTLGAVGHAYCLDAATGDVVWAKDFVADHGGEIPTWGFAASPLVWRELVILHAGVRPDGCFTAHDRESGGVVWRSVTDPAGYATPVVIDRPAGPQLICWSPENILGLIPETGKVLWSVPYEVRFGVSIATPIVQEEVVFVAGYWEGSKAIRLGQTPGDAQVIWEDNRYLRGLMSQPLYRNGFVYLLDKQHGLSCFELESGKLIWSEARTSDRLTPRDRNPQATLVWLGDEDRIIALNAEGDLVLGRLNPEGYQEQSRTKIIGRTWAHPGYAGGHVFARDDAELVCVLLTGTARHSPAGAE